MSQPSLSIVIPCFNGEITLKRCLSSIDKANQSCQVQVVVVDDGSLDNSIKVAYRCIDQMQFHVSSHVIQQENQGAPAARNAGLKHVMGSRVIFLDVDDFFLDGFVDFMVTEAGCIADVMAGNYCYAFEQTMTKPALSAELDVPAAILQGHFTGTGAIAVKTQVAKEHLWNTRLCADQDGEWTGRMLISGQSISFHPEVSLAYCLENSKSISRQASRKSIESRALVCDILLEELNLSDIIPETTKKTYRTLLARRLDSIAFNKFHVAPAICQKLYRRAREISPTYKPMYNGKSGALRKLLGFHLAARALMLIRR